MCVFHTSAKMAAAAVEVPTDVTMRPSAEGHVIDDESHYLLVGDDGKGHFYDAAGNFHQIDHIEEVDDDEPEEQEQQQPDPDTRPVLTHTSGTAPVAMGHAHQTLAIGSAANRKLMVHADPLLRDLRYSKTNLEVALNAVRVIFEYNEARHYPFTEDRSKTEKLPVLPFGSESMFDCPYCRGEKHFCPLCGLVQQAFAMVSLRTSAVPDKRLINQIKAMYYDEYKRTQSKRERRQQRMDAYDLQRPHVRPSELPEFDETEARARAEDAKDEVDAKRASGLPEWVDPYSKIQPRMNTAEEINAAAVRQQAIAQVTAMWKERMRPMTQAEAIRRSEVVPAVSIKAKSLSVTGLPAAPVPVSYIRTPATPPAPPPGFVAAGLIATAIKEAPQLSSRIIPTPVVIETFRMKRKADTPPFDVNPQPGQTILMMMGSSVHRAIADALNESDDPNSVELSRVTKRLRTSSEKIEAENVLKKASALEVERFVTNPAFIDVSALHVIKNSFTDEMKRGLELLTDSKSNLSVVEHEISKIASNCVVHNQQTFYYNVIYAKAIHIHRLKWITLNPGKTVNQWSAVAKTRFGRSDRVMRNYDTIGELATRYKRFDSVNCTYHSWNFIYRHYGGIKKAFASHGESVDKLWNS